MPLSNFSSLSANVDQNEIYYLDPSFLIEAYSANSTNPDSGQAKRLMLNIMTSGACVAFSTLGRTELLNAMKNSEVNNFKDSNAAFAKTPPKQVLKLQPNMLATAYARADLITTAAASNPAFLSFEVVLSDELVCQASKISALLNMDFNDAAHLLIMKMEDLSCFITMDKDYIPVSDPHYSIYVPDRILASYGHNANSSSNVIFPYLGNRT